MTYSFHPFQGRPSFGLDTSKSIVYEFRVSIPFREDLHSDTYKVHGFNPLQEEMFPSLSGKTFIRT